MTEEQIIRLYGERCAEHCDDCCVCEVWAMHDLIETQAREIERLSYTLGCIANEDWKDMTVGSARDLARAALGDSNDQ